MTDGAENSEVHRVTFDTTQNQPNVDVTETVADLKGVDSDALSPLYDAIDHVIENIFSDPPAPSADVEMSFTYEGYRITIRQNGEAAFRPLE